MERDLVPSKLRRLVYWYNEIPMFLMVYITRYLFELKEIYGGIKF